MANDALCYSSITQLAEQLRLRNISPVEVTQAYLNRIQEHDAKFNSFLTVTAERALAEAKAAEVNILRGKYLGCLHGVPLAHKDMIAARGIQTTCASKVLKGRVSNQDAAVMERLRIAGAILLGKLNMNEFALVPSVHFGKVNNPWDVRHTPGGSSSGSGAAVAAGLCAGSLGTDTAGSIRIPSAFCGVVGLKPTHGRVSLTGIIPLSWSLDHVGPITRSVKDAALMLQAVAGYDSRDIYSSEVPLSDYTARLTGDIKGLVLGVPKNFSPGHIDPEVKSAFEKAIKLLSGLGAQIEEVTLPPMDNVWAQLASPILNAESYIWHESYLQKHVEDYGPLTRKFLERGKGLLAADYVKAQHARIRFRRDMVDACSHVDVLLTPGQLIPPPLNTARSITINNKEVSLLAAAIFTTGPFDLTGQPAMSIPCGFTGSGLPLALQIVGKPFDEATVLRVGHAYEVHTSWHERRPLIV